MRLDYRYQSTPTIQANLQRIEVNRKLITLLPQEPQFELHLRRESLLKSSLFSAKIEGNQLHLSDIKDLTLHSKTKDAIEVNNLLKAYEYIRDQNKINLSLPLFKRLHRLTLNRLSPDAGCFRHESSAIFNQAGIAVYLPPPPVEIEGLLRELIQNLNHNSQPPLITAAIGHYGFEKIHPFLDGNGRVGRLLSSIILKNFGYDFRGLLAFEEGLNSRRDEYYASLSPNRRDITPFIDFFIAVLADQSDLVVQNLNRVPETKPEDVLLPRRREILLIIREH